MDTLSPTPSLGHRYRLPLFADDRVRRALTMLLDRASIVRGLYRGSARIISGPWAPDSPMETLRRSGDCFRRLAPAPFEAGANRPRLEFV